MRESISSKGEIIQQLGKGVRISSTGINYWNPNEEKVDIDNSSVNHHPTVERKCT